MPLPTFCRRKRKRVVCIESRNKLLMLICHTIVPMLLSFALGLARMTSFREVPCLPAQYANIPGPCRPAGLGLPSLFTRSPSCGMGLGVDAREARERQRTDRPTERPSREFSSHDEVNQIAIAAITHSAAATRRWSSGGGSCVMVISTGPKGGGGTICRIFEFLILAWPEMTQCRNPSYCERSKTEPNL